MTTTTFRQTTDGIDIEDVISWSYDEAPIEVTSLPRFSFKVPLKGGANAYFLEAGGEIEIRRAGEKVLTGLITQSTPMGGSPPVVEAKGVHKGYHYLRRYQCDDYDFDEDGDPSTTRDGITANPWAFRIYREPDSTLDSYGNGYPVHGIPLEDGVRALCGTRFVYQHVFEDNTHLLASQVSTGENRLQVTRDGLSGDKVPALQRSRDGDVFLSESRPYDLLGSTRDHSFSVATETTNPGGMFIDSSGTRLYVTSLVAGSERIHLYTLSTAFDVTSATLTTTLNTSALTSTPQPQSISFKPDGTKMYVGELSRVHEYNLSVAWDITTHSSVGLFDMNAADGYTNCRGLSFSPDGTYFYVVSNSADDVIRYTLSTPWSITTAGSAIDENVTAVVPNLSSVGISPDGLRVFLGSTDNDTIYQYHLGEPWDINNMVFVRSLDVTGEVGTPTAIVFENDGEYTFILDQGGDTVSRYDTLSGALVESVVLMNGDPYIRPMGDISTVDVVLVGSQFETDDPTIELCRDAGDASGAGLVNNTARTYTAVTLAHTANYNGSGMDAWTGTVDLSSDGATEKGMLGYRIGIEGEAGDSGTTKINYISITATTVSDIDLTEGTVESFVNGTSLVDGEGTALRGGAAGDEQNWLEGDFLGMRRHEAIERLRTTTESAEAANTSPHWDFYVDGNLAYHFKERRGADKTREYSIAKQNIVGRPKHEFWAEEVAYQTIAYGPGSGSARTRIVNKREYSAGGLYDSDRDPTTGVATEAKLANVARVMEFVDSEEQNLIGLYRKARAFHKLHRNFIEKFSVDVLTEHIRFFENGDGILLKDLPTRTNDTIRIVGLTRKGSGSAEEKLSVTLGESSPQIRGVIAGNEIRNEAITLRAGGGTATTGLSGNGTHFDKDHFGVYKFGIVDGKTVDTVHLKVTTMPWQARSKSASLSADPVSSTTQQSTGSFTSAAALAVSVDLGAEYGIGTQDAGHYIAECRLSGSSSSTGAQWELQASGDNATWATIGRSTPVLGLSPTNEFSVPVFVGEDVVELIGDGGYRYWRLLIYNTAAGTGSGTARLRIHRYPSDTATIAYGINQFGGSTPIYGSGIKMAIDPTLNASGIPSQFELDTHISTLGKFNVPQTIEIDATGWLAREDTSKEIKSGEHAIFFRSAADVANGNPNGLAVVSVTPIVKFKQENK